MDHARVGGATPSHWAALAVAIVASQAGQLLLKLGAMGLPAGSIAAVMLAQMLRWQTMLGLCCYGGGTLFYALALRRIPMSVALPCTAISYVAAALIGHFAFQEALGMAKLGALGLICAGVVLLALA